MYFPTIYYTNFLIILLIFNGIALKIASNIALKKRNQNRKCTCMRALLGHDDVVSL
jgi:hypothetical protein